ncbi:MAG: Rrf2 family transcriptional regulator [Phycisphaerales bacterium]|nr:Rrf2 family transcriptional regulator [Phycisphaerales bacterium]
MISQTSEYALRAMIHLAHHSGQARTTQQIAEATKVPSGYLSKVLQSLARGGLVNSQRGLGGGFTLARDEAGITILDVIKTVDSPLARIESCPLGLSSHTSLCALHRKLDEAIAWVENSFGSTTIADLVGNADIEPLCEAPPVDVTVTARQRND